MPYFRNWWGRLCGTEETSPRSLERRLRCVVDRIRELEKEKDHLLLQWLQETCPFTVGDEICWFGGRYTGADAVVTEIRGASAADGSFQWAITGVLLDPDGKASPTVVAGFESEYAYFCERMGIEKC